MVQAATQTKNTATEAQKNSGQTSTQTKDFSQLPAGFERVGNNVALDGWNFNEKDRVIVGTIRGSFQLTKKNRVSTVLAIETATPLKAIDSTIPKDLNDPTKNQREFAAGSIIGVRVTRALEDLVMYQNGTKVWIKCLGKKALKEEGFFWEFDYAVAAGSKKKSAEDIAAEHALRSVAATTADVSDDDIPF